MKFKSLNFLFVICALLFGFIVAGCSGSKGSKAPKKSVTIWHWMTDRQGAFDELAKRYQAQTGVKVSFDLYAPSDAYTQKVRAAAQGKTLPDIYGLLGEKRDFGSYVKSGYVADLTPYMEANNSEWKDKFYPKALAVNEFLPGNTYGVKPGIYGVPIDVMTIQMVYNKSLLKKAGFDRPPKDWKEFMAYAEKLHDIGIQGMVSGWGETWMIDCFASNYAFNIMGQDKVLATIKGDVPYTDPDWIKVFSLFKEMADNKALASGVVTMVNKTAEQLFANEKAAFAFNGSWCVNVYKGMNPDLDYAAMLPPAASDAHPMMIWGGSGSSFLVNESSANKDEAIKFLMWMTQVQQQAYLAEATNNLPSTKEASKNITPILAQFAVGMESATHPNIWGISEFPYVIEAFDKGIQSIIIGEKTPEQLAKNLRAIKERELAKQKGSKTK